MFSLDFGFRSPPKERSSKHKISPLKICLFPPINQPELFASVLEYLSSEFCAVPITSSLLFHNYSTQNEHFKRFPEYIKEDNFLKCLEQLTERNAIVSRSMYTFQKTDLVICQKDNEVLILLNRENFNERPKKLPEKVSKEIMPQKLDQKLVNMQRLKDEMKVNSLMRQHVIKQAEEARHQKYLSSLAQEKLEYGFEELRQDGVCPHETRANCFNKTSSKYCQNKHYFKLLLPHTKESLGLCVREKYIDVCQMNKCQYIHIKLEDNSIIPLLKKIYINIELKRNYKESSLPSQWINCDLRHLDYNILGKFDAIMLDPPWDIHMNLPYGTLKDKEMKSLKVKELQDNGICFLWVTGRALELGRECLSEWGYKQVDELVWVKINPNNKIVRTGRTGHWLNHSKEHCLIGIKGDTKKLNRNLDCDVLLTEVRETSRKPDEIYSVIERIAPGGRKVELFARPHNRRRGWLSLGNQLPGIYLAEDDVLQKFQETYPNMNLTAEKMNEMSKIEAESDEFHKAVYFNHLSRINKA